MERQGETAPGCEEEVGSEVMAEGREEKEEEEECAGVVAENWQSFGSGERAEELPELKPGDPVTPQHIQRLAGYTRDYLCSPTDNTYNIHFSRFKIRDLESGAVILDIKKHCSTGMKDEVEQDTGRFIQYCFSPAFLTLREIGATLEFTVGSRAVKRLRLIERHYFRNILLKSFDFEIGFCIPHSRNTYEHIYCLPNLDSDTVEEMIANPFETRSDSFYFANNSLIMHHKAEYSFSDGRGGGQAPST